jgi:hypothetical protein
MYCLAASLKGDGYFHQWSLQSVWTRLNVRSEKDHTFISYYNFITLCISTQESIKTIFDDDDFYINYACYNQVRYDQHCFYWILESCKSLILCRYQIKDMRYTLMYL